MGLGWWRSLVISAGVILVSTGCAALQQQVSNSPEASPSSVSSPSPSALPSPSPGGAALAIAGPTLHAGEVGIAYAATTLTAAGGSSPYTWAVSAGTLPAGLALTSSGTISGKGTKAGTFGFTVKVTDSGGTTADAKASIKMYGALSVTPRCATVCHVGIQCTTCGSFGSLAGGLGPYRYTLTAGAVPTGMTWSALALGGPFPNSRTTSWSMTVQVADQFGASKSVVAKWLTFKPIAYVGTSPYAGCYSPGSGVCFNNTDLQYTLGNPSDKVTVKVVKACYWPSSSELCTTNPKLFPTYLPPNWAATAKGGVVTVSMNCATSCSNWYGDVYIVLVDRGVCVAPSHAQSTLQADVNIDI